ncbi:hypothetical protein D3C71_1394570 [compost metagenome]
MQHDDQLLAQQQRQSGAVEARLLATDQQRSVLNVLDVARPHSMAYTPYGHRPAENGLLSLLGFNDERPDPVTGCYLLGNGYRAFNPVLMRFNSPDSWSPFGRGGLNTYAYCVGDPVNRQDSSGHFPRFLKGYNPIKALQNRLGLRMPSGQNALPSRGSTPVGSNSSSTAEATISQESMGNTIASQQRTIESQQKIIASQQKHLDSVEIKIKQGLSIISDYKTTIIQQEKLIADLQSKVINLMDDLAFSLHINSTATKTAADVAAAYGSYTPLQQPGTSQIHIQQKSTSIRNS